jgi:hypothetical protein
MFDPVALGLHPAVPNVFNFTTINIGPGVTVRLTSKILTGPVYWLAQGPVTVNGLIDASGETGYLVTNNISDRVPAAGGAGGYSGGVGGNGSTLSPESGNGPGGSAGTTTNNATGVPQFGGVFTGSQYLIPLIGGSGGGGGVPGACGTTFGPGGGGGGGALLLASSVSIALSGTATMINARGGDSGNNSSASTCGQNVPGGSGGAVRLVAPTIAVNDAVLAIDARGGSFGGGNGVVRMEAYTINPIGPGVVAGTLVISAPFMVVPPLTAPSSITVTNINGNPINANPFSFPDTTINASGPVTVSVQAQFIPVGTIPKITVMSETGPDQTVNCSALQGTLQQSTCSAQITFPTGGSRGFVKATWTQ